MKKKFVLDTNVLLHDPKSIYSFGDNDVIIIMSVISQVDDFKKSPGELGANAREVARQLDKLSKEGAISKGVLLENGGRLFVYPHRYVKLSVNHEDETDSKILMEATCLMNEGENVIVVSKDTFLRVLARGTNIQAEDYETDVKIVKKQSGIRTIDVDKETADSFNSTGSVRLESKDPLIRNQFVLVKAGNGPVLGIVEEDLVTVRRINEKSRAFNIRPRNLEQTFAMHALLDDNIKLVTLQGQAGTGKTLLAVACGLSKREDGEYARMVVTRPVIPVGRDLGFLPGDLGEKMSPWMQPIYDAIDLVKMLDSKSRSGKNVDYLDSEEEIQIAPLAYIRGRSITHSYMIVDEAQNMTPLEIKTLVTRCGAGTKMVFTGDIDQIDNPFLNRSSNGFVYLVSKFMGDALHAHVTLTKGERSELATKAAKLL